jgi:hypothetical protein
MQDGHCTATGPEPPEVLMPDDPKPPTDTKLSEADVKRVLERAVQIDGAQPGVSVSELTQSAREAGISENAVLQAVQELLEGREIVSTPGPVTTASGTARVASAVLRAAALGVSSVIALVVVSLLIRLLFP